MTLPLFVIAQQRARRMRLVPSGPASSCNGPRSSLLQVRSAYDSEVCRAQLADPYVRLGSCISKDKSVSLALPLPDCVVEGVALHRLERQRIRCRGPWSRVDPISGPRRVSCNARRTGAVPSLSSRSPAVSELRTPSIVTAARRIRIDQETAIGINIDLTIRSCLVISDSDDWSRD